MVLCTPSDPWWQASPGASSPLRKIIHLRRKSLVEEGPDAVDDQLGFDPHPHAAQAADPTGQANQPAPEGGQVTKVPLDLVARRVQRLAEGAGQQVQPAEAVRALVTVSQPLAGTLGWSNQLMIMPHR